MPNHLSKAKKAATRPPKDLPYRFDYDRLRHFMQQAGGIKAVCERAGMRRANFYEAKRAQPLPISRTLRNILSELEIPLSVLRSLFIKDEK
jgi:hypothetical protein